MPIKLPDPPAGFPMRHRAAWLYDMGRWVRSGWPIDVAYWHALNQFVDARALVGEMPGERPTGRVYPIYSAAERASQWGNVREMQATAWERFNDP